MEGAVDLRLGTLSKALGGTGGFVAGRRELIDWLVNRARSYFFSTAHPAAAAAASRAALRIVRDEPHRREGLLQTAEDLRTTLQRDGWNVGASSSHIVPIIVGEATNALALSERLLDRGVLAPAIRPPSVPQGQALLRISPLRPSHDGDAQGAAFLSFRN